MDAKRLTPADEAQMLREHYAALARDAAMAELQRLRNMPRASVPGRIRRRRARELAMEAR